MLVVIDAHQKQNQNLDDKRKLVHLFGQAFFFICAPKEQRSQRIS